MVEPVRCFFPLVYKEVLFWGEDGVLCSGDTFSFSMGSNYIIIPDVQVLITGDEDLSDKNQEKEIYTKKAVTKTAGSEEKESLQKDTTGRGTELPAFYFLLAF